MTDAPRPNDDAQRRAADAAASRRPDREPKGLETPGLRQSPALQRYQGERSLRAMENGGPPPRERPGRAGSGSGGSDAGGTAAAAGGGGDRRHHQRRSEVDPRIGPANDQRIGDMLDGRRSAQPVGRSDRRPQERRDDGNERRTGSERRSNLDRRADPPSSSDVPREPTGRPPTPPPERGSTPGPGDRTGDGRAGKSEPTGAARVVADRGGAAQQNGVADRVGRPAPPASAEDKVAATAPPGGATERSGEPDALRRGKAFHNEVQDREAPHFQKEVKVAADGRDGRADLVADRGARVFVEELKNSDLDRMARSGTLDRNLGSHNRQLGSYEDGLRAARAAGGRPDVGVHGTVHYGQEPAGPWPSPDPDRKDGEGVREYVEIKNAGRGHQTVFDRGTDAEETHLTRLPPEERSWDAIATAESTAGRPGAEYLDARAHAERLRDRFT